MATVITYTFEKEDIDFLVEKLSWTIDDNEQQIMNEMAKETHDMHYVATLGSDNLRLFKIIKVLKPEFEREWKG